MNNLSQSEYEWCRWFANQPQSKKLEVIASLTDDEAVHLQFTWEAWARDKQLEPSGNWAIWLLMCGRGFGKTRVGAEWIRRKSQSYARLGLIGRTAADVRDVMVEGESGILAISPHWERPEYIPSKRRLTWPNGAQATTYSADEPESLRGPQHEKLWMDEPGAWQYEDAFDQAMFGLRLGDNPQAVMTTTPRVTKLIKRIVKSATTVITVGSTYENKVNLAPTFLEQIVGRYSGTRLGRQEILGELLEDPEGALWTRDMVESSHVEKASDMVRIVVGVDPAVTSGEESNATGIVVVGKGIDGLGYVLYSESVFMSPDAWARRVVHLYHYYQADRIVAESNQGGDLVTALLRTVDKSVPVTLVRATRGKIVRAEPVAALWEQGRVKIVV